jgi:hypothetical protein
MNAEHAQIDLRAPSPSPTRAPGPERAPRPEDSHAEERWLVCSACEHPVTTARARREIEGAHVHVRVNPHGSEFRFGCFSDAPGCAAQGESSAFFTWFPGYSWQIAVCAGCAAHLGWSFRSAGDVFFGLITDRLHERSLPDGP